MKRRLFLVLTLLLCVIGLCSCSLNLDDLIIKPESNVVENYDSSVEGDPVEEVTTEEVVIQKEELVQAKPVNNLRVSNILNLNQWYLQYPSGTDGGGMLACNLTDELNTKYFGMDNNYVRFSLNAQDKGKSANGSSVRSELHSLGEKYYFSGQDQIDGITHPGSKAEFNYTFKVNCTQPEVAKYTVGQFEMFSGMDANGIHTPDKPLIMISVVMGQLYAYIKYYTRSYVDGQFVQLQKTDKIALGAVENLKDISIRIVLNDRKIDIYRDGNHLIDMSFKENQDTMFGVYFKLGIYYQTLPTDERITYLNTDVYVKDVSLKIS